MIWRARSRFASGLRAAAPVGGMGAVALLLLRCPPERSHFYLRCPVYEMLHLRCPGCGATRALAALLRGQFVEAWHQNALFVLTLPMIVGYGVVWYSRWVRDEAMPRAQALPVAVSWALIIAVAFMAIRNSFHAGL